MKDKNHMIITCQPLDQHPLCCMNRAYSATRSVTLSRLIFSCQALDHFLLCWSFSAWSTTGSVSVSRLTTAHSAD